MTTRGQHNSSKTRVAPVFDGIFDSTDPATSADRLRRLLELPKRFDGVTPQRPIAAPVVERAWDPDERKLAAPRKLLRWLVEHPEGIRAASLRSKMSDETRELRTKLVAG